MVNPVEKVIHDQIYSNYVNLPILVSLFSVPLLSSTVRNHATSECSSYKALTDTQPALCS